MTVVQTVSSGHKDQKLVLIVELNGLGKTLLARELLLRRRMVKSPVPAILIGLKLRLAQRQLDVVSYRMGQVLRPRIDKIGLKILINLLVIPWISIGIAQ